jgi:hypothetical protein
MSDALFLPRELFQPDAPRPTQPAVAPRRRAVHFTSGADVAADLLLAMNDGVAEPTFVERRRKPRTGKAFETTR